MSHDDLEQRIRQLAWPAPSASLRTRVLSSAPPTPPVATWADRVWFSRAWRLGGVGVVAAVLAFEAWSAPTGPSRVVGGRQVASWSAIALMEAERDLGLPPGVFDALARRDAPYGARPRVWSTLDLSDLTGDR